jgi:hypothetical protein
MSSNEVDAAVGERPARENVKSAAELWRENRAACSAARERFNVARSAGDAEGMAREIGLIDAIEILGRELEREAAAEREQTATLRATSRMVGITRAYGSVVKQLEEDEKRVIEKITELQDAITRLNDRYGKAALLRAESAALSDRFGLAKPNMANVVPPARRDFVTTLVTMPRDLLDHPTIRQPVEECDFKLRTRRTYSEVSGSEGFAIIQGAGLKPFAPLTEKQQLIVEARERQAEHTRRQFEQHASIAPERWGS